MVKLGKGDSAKNKALSPFRDEKNPSFGIFERDGRWFWKDFNGEGGDELDFLMALENYDKGQALRFYKELAGISTDGGDYAKSTPAVPAYDWKSAKESLTKEKIGECAKWRGLPADFIESLGKANLIGVLDGCFAFPVRDRHDTAVVGAHVRSKGDSGWRYQGGVKTSESFPYVMGDHRKASTILVGESQWDVMAIAASLGWIPDDEEAIEDMAFVATRGASSGSLAGFISPKKGAKVILVPQNDPDKGDGKPTPAQKWAESAIESLKKIGVSALQMDVPITYKDANDWVRAGATLGDIAKSIEKARSLRKSALPPIDDGTTFVDTEIPLPAELVQGVLHQGTKLVLGGPSKAYKTWALLDLCVSVSTGTDWWGFSCVKGPVLYINFEIPRPFMRRRLEAVCQAKAINLKAGDIDIWNLRGHAASFEKLLEEIIEQVKARGYVLIVIDPTYKVMGERDENSASDMNNLMNTFEQICNETNAAVAFGSHFAKGNAAGKEAIDRISGSGVTARDPDSIITLTRHSAGDAYFTADFTLRNMPKVEPFVLMREHPLMIRCEELDPNDLKRPERQDNRQGGGGGGRASSEDRERKKLEKDQRKWAPVLAELTAPMLAGSWYEAVKDQGVSRATFFRYLEGMKEAELIWMNPSDKKWEKSG
jgi:hypothetical protein